MITIYRIKYIDDYVEDKISGEAHLVSFEVTKDGDPFRTYGVGYEADWVLIDIAADCKGIMTVEFDENTMKELREGL